MIKQHTYPTKYPLLEFHLAVWKLKAGVIVMSPADWQVAYDYLMLRVDWSGNKLFEIRLWDTTRRIDDRLGNKIHSGVDLYTEKELEEIRDQAQKYIDEKKFAGYESKLKKIMKS